MLEAFRGQHLRGLEFDYQLLLGRCLHRKLSRFLAFEDAVDVGGAAVPLCDHAILMRALDNEFLFGGLAHNHFGSRQNPAEGIGKSPGGVLMLGRGKH